MRPDDEVFDHTTKVMLARKRRDKFRTIKATVEFKRWRRRQYDKVQRRLCAYCRKPMYFKTLHVDHVFPLY